MNPHRTRTLRRKHRGIRLDHAAGIWVAAIYPPADEYGGREDPSIVGSGSTRNEALVDFDRQVD